MEHIKSFEQFIAESKDNSYPLNEMGLSTVLIINALLTILAWLTIFPQLPQTIIAGLKQRVQDMNAKRKINKDSIEDMTDEIESLVDQLPMGKKRFMKSLLSKLRATIDSSGNVDKDSALYLQRELDRYAQRYGIKNTTM